MADLANPPEVLAGPLVRRVEPTRVSVWVALSKARTVELGIWTGDVLAGVGGGVFGNGAAAHTTSASTRRLGTKLHVAVVSLDLAAAPLTPGQVYSYNLVFSGGGPSSDLRSLQLLQDSSDANYPHLALGYVPGQLPSFVMPPVALTGLRITHGSCRKFHGHGSDSLEVLDHLIDRTRAAAPAERPQLLILTGDQIYADDVPAVLSPNCTEVGIALLGKTEKLPVLGGMHEATQTNFPANRRQKVVDEQAKFTSGNAASHLLSFGEFCAAYLLSLSNVLWPQSLPDVDTLLVPPGGSPSLPGTALPALPTGKELERAKKSLRNQAKRVQPYRDSLPRVRRALANIPSYMIFDDHEVTDDWYLTQQLRDRVLTSTLGVTVVRNGLMAYAAFQAWGNDPVAFSAGSRQTLLDRIEDLSQASPDDTTVVNQIDPLLGLDGNDPPVHWHYSAPVGPTQVVVLDTRTRRSFASRISPPGLLSDTALSDQLPALPPSPGAEILVLVSPAPVLGLTLVEELVQPLGSRISDLVHTVKAHSKPAKTDNDKKLLELPGHRNFDMEAWSMNAAEFEKFLAKLQPMKKVVILSGDVHYGATASMDYWKQGEPQATRLVQLTSSALKNAEPPPKTYLLTSGRAQRLLGNLLVPAERLAWRNPADVSVSVPGGATIPPRLRWRLRESPVLLPTEGWPAGTTFSAAPHWAWRMVIDSDQRPDDATAGARPTDAQPGFVQPDVEPNDPNDGYVATLVRHEKALKSNISRQVVFNTNLGAIHFTGTGATLRVHHEMFFMFPSEAKPGDPKAYTAYDVSLAASTDPQPSV